MTVYRDPDQTVSDAAAALTPEERATFLLIDTLHGDVAAEAFGCHPATRDLLEDRGLIFVYEAYALTGRGAQVAQLLRAETDQAPAGPTDPDCTCTLCADTAAKAQQ